MSILLVLAAAAAAATAPAPAAPAGGGGGGGGGRGGGAAAAAPVDYARLFAFIDADKSGSISKFEWIGAGRDVRKWNTVDTSKDGTISAAELQAAPRTAPPAGGRGGDVEG
jgi:hypothetical protein